MILEKTGLEASLLRLLKPCRLWLETSRLGLLEWRKSCRLRL